MKFLRQAMGPALTNNDQVKSPNPTLSFYYKHLNQMAYIL